MKTYEHHPISDLLPIVPASEIKDLAADIGKNGLQFPIILYEGKILDGRHRYEACEQADVKPRFENYTGDNPMGFVISANLKRRHLTDTQRVMIAAKMATMKQGARTDIIASKGSDEPSATWRSVSQSQASELLDVSTRSVSRAVKIIEASPRLAKQVVNKKISLHAAHEQVMEKERAKEPKAPRTDRLNRTIPDDVIPDWDRAVEVGNHLRSLMSEVKLAVEKGIKDQDLVFREITNPTISEAEALRYTLSQILPYVVCPGCQGRNRKNCMMCKRRGWISKCLYDSPAVPRATKAILEKGATK